MTLGEIGNLLQQEVYMYIKILRSRGLLVERSRMEASFSVHLCPCYIVSLRYIE